MNPHHPFWRFADRMGAGLLLLLLLAVALLPWIESSWSLHERLVSTSFGVFVYLLVFLIAAILFAFPIRDRRQCSYRSAFLGVWIWIARWHGISGLGILGGALAGALLYPIGGILFRVDGEVGQHLLKGIRDGAMYLTIWSPGASLVLCFMLAFGGTAPSSNTSV